jgi:adenylate cyclase
MGLTAPSGESTFLFADLSGFTALTEAHGDEESAELTNRFFASVRRLLAEHGAEEVKTIGDAVMIRAPAAAEGVRLGVRIVQEIGAQHGFPSIRIGMHTGPAAERSGDWFGATVNTAARVAGMATGGEVLVTDATRQAAGTLKEVEFRGRGREALKNVAEPLPVYVAVAQGARSEDELPIDPVCRMAIAPGRAAGRMMHQGVEYHFCSLECASSFSAAPERHVGQNGRADAGCGRHVVTAFVQGGSYIGFGLWSLLAREHYRRAHSIRRGDWMLNAHGAWLLAVGSTLAAAGLRREADRPELRVLGAGSALGLALNDAILHRRLPPIYHADLAYELGLLGAWLLPIRRGRASARRRRQRRLRAEDRHPDPAHPRPGDWSGPRSPGRPDARGPGMARLRRRGFRLTRSTWRSPTTAPTRAGPTGSASRSPRPSAAIVRPPISRAYGSMATSVAFRRHQVLATTGEEPVVQRRLDGRLVRIWGARLPRNQLMRLTLDARSRRALVGLRGGRERDRPRLGEDGADRPPRRPAARQRRSSTPTSSPWRATRSPFRRARRPRSTSSTSARGGSCGGRRPEATSSPSWQREPISRRTRRRPASAPRPLGAAGYSTSTVIRSFTGRPRGA